MRSFVGLVTEEIGGGGYAVEIRRRRDEQFSYMVRQGSGSELAPVPTDELGAPAAALLGVKPEIGAALVTAALGGGATDGVHAIEIILEMLEDLLRGDRLRAS